MSRTNEDIDGELRALALIDRVTGGDGASRTTVAEALLDLRVAGVQLDTCYVDGLLHDARLLGRK